MKTFVYVESVQKAKGPRIFLAFQVNRIDYTLWKIALWGKDLLL